MQICLRSSSQNLPGHAFCCGGQDLLGQVRLHQRKNPQCLPAMRSPAKESCPHADVARKSKNPVQLDNFVVIWYNMHIMKDFSRKDSVLDALIDENVALYHVLRAVAAQFHSGIGLTAAKRGLLRSLSSGGPQTVPQMARARFVSRQHIQTVVNQLLKEQLVELIPNPSHKRSSLVRLTRRGRQVVNNMLQKETCLLAELQAELDEEELQIAVSVLQKLRSSFVHIYQEEVSKHSP